MRSYKDVVKDRYDNEKDIHIYDNIYSLINPIGFYINQKIRNIFYKIFNKIRKAGIDVSKIKILDLGCGNGAWTRFFSELQGTTENIYGLDLSNNRIKRAKSLNPNIKYLKGDIINLNIKNINFDLISSIDIFSHLNEKVQIAKSLKNIHNLLNNNGFFLYYDIYNKNHFKSKKNNDSFGFNKKEIINFCTATGFKCIYYSTVFKKIFWKYHSAYIAGKNIQFWIISILEKILPGSAGNMVFLFKKL